MALTLEEMVAKRRGEKKAVSAPAGVDRRKAIMDRINAEAVAPAPPAAPVPAAPAPQPPTQPSSSIVELATWANRATQPQSRRDLESQWPTSPPKPVIAPARPAIAPAVASAPVIPSMPSDAPKVNPLLQGGETAAAPTEPPAVAVNPILEPEPSTPYDKIIQRKEKELAQWKERRDTGKRAEWTLDRGYVTVNDPIDAKGLKHIAKLEEDIAGLKKTKLDPSLTERFAGAFTSAFLPFGIGHGYRPNPTSSIPSKIADVSGGLGGTVASFWAPSKVVGKLLETMPAVGGALDKLAKIPKYGKIAAKSLATFISNAGSFGLHGQIQTRPDTPISERIRILKDSEFQAALFSTVGILGHMGKVGQYAAYPAIFAVGHQTAGEGANETDKLISGFTLVVLHALMSGMPKSEAERIAAEQAQLAYRLDDARVRDISRELTQSADYINLTGVAEKLIAQEKAVADDSKPVDSQPKIITSDPINPVLTPVEPAKEPPTRIPLLEPERVAQPSAEVEVAPRPAEQVAAPEAARAAEPQAAPRAAPEPTLASRYTPEQLAEMKAEQEKRIGEMRGPGDGEAKAQGEKPAPKETVAKVGPEWMTDDVAAKLKADGFDPEDAPVNRADVAKYADLPINAAIIKAEAKQPVTPRTAADLAKPAQEPARVAEPAQEPAPPKPTTPLAKLVADTPQAFRVTSSRGNVHNVKMPDGVTYPIRAESKAEAIAKAQELASRTPEDVIDDSIRMVEEAKSQAEKDAKGGYVSTGAATPVERVLRRAMEGFFGHMRAFGEQYVSDRPLMRRLEQAYHERAAAVESGIADIGKILVEAGPRRLEDGVAVAIAIEEGVARDTLPPSARRLYDLSKQTMDAITDLEKAEGVLKKGFPEGTRDAINEKIAEIQAKRKMNKADMEEVSRLQEELAVLDKFAAYLPHGIVARRVMQKIFEEGNGRARRDLGNRLEQFHHQRKGRGTMREYLEAKVIRPEDMDIGRLMMDSAVSAYQKISMKALMDYGIENKYIRFGHKAPGDPKEWFEMPQLAKPAQVFKVSPPEGQKVWVQRLFGLGLEELSGAQNKPTTAFDKVLSIVKVGQFYNPKIIWSYNLQQRIYGGAVEWNPVKDAINTKDAWRAVLTDNEDYQQANRLGIFQVPDNIPRATVDSQIDIATRSMRTDLSRGGVIGNQLVKVLERATGEKMDPQAWKDKNLRAALDAIMLPLRGISSATWMGDKVQRMHTFYNLTRRGMSPQDAAEQTIRMHGAYSKIGKEYKAWARRVFFVHSFRLLMPIQTMRAYTTPIKIAMKALTGKDIPQGEIRRAIMALAGTVLFPTLIDSALRYNGWTPTEEEEEFFKKGPMKYLRIPVGKDGYRVTLALPNWKYKKTFMYDGEEREVVLGVNNIANMATKWIMRAAPKDNIVSPTTKDLPIMTLLKWEISPLYRIGMDIFDNNSSFGTAPPRGSTGKDWDSAVGYLFGNIWRMYGDAYRMVSDDRESDVYKERQMAEMMEAMNLGDRVLQNVFGYAYTRAGPEKRVDSMINALRRSAGEARSTAEIHYKGETLEEKIAEIDILEAKMERALRRRYNAPRPPAEIVRIITDPGLADNPSKQANAARLVKYGMDGMTAKDLRTALVKEAREQGWNTEMYDSKGKLTAYGRRKLQLSRFIRKHNIE